MKSVKLPLSVAVMAASFGAHAVEPQGILFDGGVTVMPSVELSVENNDNVYLQPDETKESSTVTRLAPSISVAADLGQTQLAFDLAAENGTYSSDDDDNYTDVRVKAGADFELTSRNALALSAQFNSLHDARGAGTTEGSAALEIEDPDEYDETDLDAAFTYGSDSAMFNVTFGANRYEKEYQNNLDVAAAGNRDHVKITLSADTAVYLSDRSNFLIDLSTTDIDYSEDNIITQGREGRLNKALVGASYELTGKLSGSAKVGVAERKFDANGIDTDSALSWEIQGVWTPRTYSTVTVFTSQSSNEASSVGNYIDTQYSMVSWKHDFSQYYSLTADLSYASDTYYNEANDREDDTLSYGLKGIYSPTTSVDVHGSIKQADRDSSTDGLDYEQQVVSLGVTWAI